MKRSDVPSGSVIGSVLTLDTANDNFCSKPTSVGNGIMLRVSLWCTQELFFWEILRGISSPDFSSFFIQTNLLQATIRYRLTNTVVGPIISALTKVGYVFSGAWFSDSKPKKHVRNSVFESLGNI
jgi:hypothetical protein